MNQREMIVGSTASAVVLRMCGIAAVGTLTLGNGRCGSTKTLAKWTGVGMEMLSQMSPILNNMGATGIVGLVAKALPIMSKLKKAFEDNDNVSALQLFNNLTNAQTGVIVEISNALGVLQGQKRVILLGLMASASVMLRLIAANISDEVPASDAAIAREAVPKAAGSMARAARAEALERAFAVSRF